MHMYCLFYLFLNFYFVSVYITCIFLFPVTPETPGSFQKQVITWNNNDCSGDSTCTLPAIHITHSNINCFSLRNLASVFTTVTTQCLGGNTFSCIDNSSEVETWPGIGTWQPEVDNGLGR